MAKKTFADRIMDYVDSPRMRQRVKSGNSLSCVVDGNYGSYRTHVTLAPKKIKKADCTCPSDYWPCKHVNALVATYQKVPKSFVDADVLLTGLAAKPSKELLRLMREMILAAPASLQALGVEGFDDDAERYE